MLPGLKAWAPQLLKDTTAPTLSLGNCVRQSLAFQLTFSLITGYHKSGFGGLSIFMVSVDTKKHRIDLCLYISANYKDKLFLSTRTSL